MPRYFFSIQAPDEEARAEYAAELKDDAAALAYACEIVREQCKSLTGLNSQVRFRTLPSAAVARRLIRE